jgi:hypothetical protein
MTRYASALAAALFLFSPVAFSQGKACDLITPEEIQAALGAKPSLKPSTLPSGVDVCAGKAGASTVTIRLYTRKDDAELEKEDAKLDQLKAAGATIETRKVGGMSCMELRPGGKAARQAYTTTCTTPSTSKAPKYAMIEVSNPSQSMEMRQLAPLAQSIAGRLY